MDRFGATAVGVCNHHLDLQQFEPSQDRALAGQRKGREAGKLDYRHLRPGTADDWQAS